MSKQAGLELAQETIAFQSKDFGLQLEAVIEEALTGNISAKEIDKTISPRLSKIVYDTTGLKTQFVFNCDSDPISFPSVFKNNLILSDNEANYTKRQANSVVKYIKENKLVNTVNIKTAKVTGLFSEVTSPIMFSWEIIKHFRLTKEEVVAVLLHEIGHIFTFYEYQNRFVTSNQVLAALLMSAKNDTVEEFTYVYKTASEVLTGNKNSLDALETTKDSTIITTIVIDKTIEAFKSQTQSLYTDSVSAEQLADAFAARFGYAKAFITASEKMFLYSELDKRPFLRNCMHAVEIAALITKTILTVFVSIVNPFIAAGLCTLYVSAILKINSTTGANSRDTYDDQRVRYLRMKEQLIEHIKDRSLPPSEVKKLIEDLDTIEPVIEQYAKSAYQPLIVQAINYVFRRHRIANDVKNMQRTLEELASNELFVRSAQLSLLQSKSGK